MSAGPTQVRSEAPRLRLGTRGSALALIQSRRVAAALEAGAGASVSLHTIRTQGDQQADASLARIGGEGVFTSALDGALLDGAVDVAVHSLKDVPTRMPSGLCVAATPSREDPRDALVLPAGEERTLATLAAGSRIGTGSQRRAALARAFRPDCEVVPMRGNVDTRLAKLDRGDCDALVLAAAGLGRMGLLARASELLERTAWLPAAGQGALAVVVRRDRPAGAADWRQRSTTTPPGRRYRPSASCCVCSGPAATCPSACWGCPTRAASGSGRWCSARVAVGSCAPTTPAAWPNRSASRPTWRRSC